MFSILPRDGLLIFRGTTLVPILSDRLSLICLTRSHVASYLVCILSVQKQNSGVKLNYTLNLTKLPAADFVSLKEKCNLRENPCTIIVFTYKFTIAHKGRKCQVFASVSLCSMFIKYISDMFTNIGLFHNLFMRKQFHTRKCIHKTQFSLF